MPVQQAATLEPDIPAKIQEQTTATDNIEWILNPRNVQGNKFEHLLTIQRIQDLSIVLPQLAPGADLYHLDDFSKSQLRHLGMWRALDAYTATAMWMRAVGPARYMQYVNDAKTLAQLTNEVASSLCAGTQNGLSRDSSNSDSIHSEHSTPTSMSSRRSGSSYIAPYQSSPTTSITNHRDSWHKNGIDYDALVNHRMNQAGNQWQGLIPDYKKYKAYKSAYLRIKDHSPRDLVTPFPEHDPQIQARVRGIYEAILDMTDVIDNPRLKQKTRFKKRKASFGDGDANCGDYNDDPEFVDPVAIARIKELKSIEIEILSWDLVEHAWYCQQGQYNIPLWNETRNPGKAPKSARPGVFLNLEERLEKCEEALRHSKTCVKQMLMVDFTKRLAFNPAAEAKRKFENKEVNAKRDVENRAGKYAKAQGFVIIDEDRSIKDAANGAKIARPHPLNHRIMAAVKSESPACASVEEPGDYYRVLAESRGVTDMSGSASLLHDPKAWPANPSVGRTDMTSKQKHTSAAALTAAASNQLTDLSWNMMELRTSAMPTKASHNEDHWSWLI